jgi:hypothetical protein
MFKKLIYVFFSLVLFALVWAAGHDILQGEPEVWQEWVITWPERSWRFGFYCVCAGQIH